MNKLVITRPDDWHIHLRDDDFLEQTVKDISRYMSRAIVMPNLVPPIINAKMAQDYQKRIMVHAENKFNPLMTLYLTDNTTVKDIEEAIKAPHVFAVKLYPAGATTNSSSGVTNIKNIYPLLEIMEKAKFPLLLHGEVTSSDIDIYDREKVFIDKHLIPTREKFPNLKIVLEHITTKDAVEYVLSQKKNTAATITAHHLMFNRNDMLVGGLKPHLYCLPILKRDIHQNALITAATSGDSRFFLGTDSAPHAKHKKESSCCGAGSYTAHASLELYAEIFEEKNALQHLEVFASFNGPDFYNLPRNKDKITLVKENWLVPEHLPFGDTILKPIRANENISWKILD